MHINDHNESEIKVNILDNGLGVPIETEKFVFLNSFRPVRKNKNKKVPELGWH